MSKGPGLKGVYLLMLLAAGCAAALAYYVKTTPGAARVPDELRRPKGGISTPAPRVDAQVSTEPKGHSSASRTVKLPQINAENVTLGGEKTVPEGTDPKVFMADEVLAAFKMNGVRTLGVDVRDGTAFVNFNDAIDKGFGSFEEGTFLKALQVSFGQFADVKNLRIERNGEAMDTLGGHIELTDPVPVVRGPQTESKPTTP